MNRDELAAWAGLLALAGFAVACACAMAWIRHTGASL